MDFSIIRVYIFAGSNIKVSSVTEISVKLPVAERCFQRAERLISGSNRVGTFPHRPTLSFTHHVRFIPSRRFAPRGSLSVSVGRRCILALGHWRYASAWLCILRFLWLTAQKSTLVGLRTHIRTHIQTWQILGFHRHELTEKQLPFAHWGQIREKPYCLSVSLSEYIPKYASVFCFVLPAAFTFSFC